MLALGRGSQTEPFLQVFRLCFLGEKSLGCGLTVHISGYHRCMELIFEVREAEEGGYVARALGQAIFTEADTWAELRENVLEVASLHFEDASAKPSIIQLHFVKDELIAFEAA